MVLENPIWTQNLPFEARLDRQFVSILFTAGVIDINSHLRVTPRSAGANMSVDVAAGQVVVVGTEQADQGAYLCRSTAVENRAVASNAGAERFDRVIARVADSAVSGTVDGWFIEVLTGTSGAGEPPALPASAEHLATIRVPTDAASITADLITDGRRQSGRPSLQIGTQADPLTEVERDADPPAEGRLVWNKTKLRLEVADGAQYWPPGGAHCLLRHRSAVQKIPNGQDTPVAFDTTVASGTKQDTPEVLTPNADGSITINETIWAVVRVGVQFASSSGGSRRINLYSVFGIGRWVSQGGFGGENLAITVPLVRFGAGETLRVEAYQSSGGDLNIEATWATFFSIDIRQRGA